MLTKYKTNSMLAAAFLLLTLIFTAAIISCKGDIETKPVAEVAKPAAKAAPKAKEEAKKMNLVRMPAVAGAFYPGDPGTIKRMLTDYFAKAKVPESKGKLMGLVVPHAGYIYSGGVAAYSYKAITNPDEIETVILLGPSHRAAFNGISVFPGGVYQTPLGDLEIDEEIAGRLIGAASGIGYVEEAHLYEHSLEVQLPFIQTIFKDVKIVTAVLGFPDPDADKKFVDEIVRITKEKNVLIVASSDFSHYHDYKTAMRMDNSAIESIIRMSTSELLQKNESGESELCGINPVKILLNIMNKLGADKAQFLHYANSGDVPAGDKTKVVGYAAIAFYDTDAAKRKKPGDDEGADTGASKAEPGDDELSRDDKRKLLSIARDTINEYVRNKKRLEVDDITEPKLLVKNGAFVTIKMNGALRGCIGNFVSQSPLYETIIEMAVSAATKDPRFPPVSVSELDQLELEISVLSPLREISDINEIQVGKHGIYITKGFFRGVLLPQVATEYGWDRITFLEQTCRKAGLGKDEWKDGATIFIYSAQVFSMDDL